MRLKIQTTTAIGLLFAGLLPLIVLLALFTFSTRSELKQAALKERSSLTRRLATEIEGLLQNVVVDLNLISSNPLLVGSATDSSSRDSEFLRLGRDSRFTELALFDSEGYLIAASEEIGVTQDRSPWFERCVERSCTVVSDPIRVGDSNDLAVVVYEAVPADLESDVAVVRVEELYPFPADRIAQECARYPGAEVVWCQEEPRNMGVWPVYCDWLRDLLPDTPPRYVGRKPAASPAPGSSGQAKREQAALIAEALSESRPNG